VSEIDWMDTPLEEFYSQPEFGEDARTTGQMVFPHGDGTAHAVLRSLQSAVESTYGELIATRDFDRLEKTGEVPVIRNGQRGYEPLDELTLRDLPAVLDTFVVLEEEREKEKLEEAERKRAERKERERVRAKERRKRKKLGEWWRIPEANWIHTPHS
jgi:hypothetical protein